jgi:hypothetical protein
MPVGIVVLGVCAMLLVGTLALTAPQRAEAMRKQREREQTIAERDACLALRDEIAVRRRAGADVNELAALEARLANCARSTGAVQPWEASLAAMAGQRRQVDYEWANYRTTTDTDAIKRNNTRGTWLRLTDEYMTAAREALALAADSREGSQAIEAELLSWAASAHDRAVCFGNGASPCSRYGLNEPHNAERAHDEIDRGILPVLGSDGTMRTYSGFVSYRGRDFLRRVMTYGPGLLDVARAQVARNTRFSPTQATRTVRAIGDDARRKLQIR